MTLRLAVDTLAISHGNNTVRLRPSLRAGLQIIRSLSVANLWTNLRDIHFTTIADLIRIGADDTDAGSMVLARKVADDGIFSLTTYLPTLWTFAEVSLGLGDSIEDQSFTRAADKIGMAHDKALEELFGIGTGRLGWTPKDTWEATPAEIIAAHVAHDKMLLEIHSPGTEDKEPTYADFRAKFGNGDVRATG